MILGYIDPGQGMLIWQAIVSAFVGVLFYLKKTRQFIAGLFWKMFGRNRTNNTPVTIASDLPAIKAETKAEAQ
ncbi:MAG TPA: hypothetical protein VN625_07860 [Desulfuromonadaceae bacterium]|nr:hypothetical protein [Desulfuromonadaceae bacterium]